MEYVISDTMLNYYAFGNPTPKEREELYKSGFKFFQLMNDGKEMWYADPKKVRLHERDRQNPQYDNRRTGKLSDCPWRGK